jgi:hypothetical protein
VGIGTSSPTNGKLEVAGNAYATNYVLPNDGYVFWGAGDGSTAIRGNSSTDLISLITSGIERARIDSSGNLLVGTTAISYGNRVESTGGFASLGHPQFNITSTTSSTPFEWVLRSGTSMQFYVNNSAVVATLTTSGVWTNASDARYKENIRPITYGLAEVMQLLPCAYNIIGSEKQEIGFVAQEVEPLLPELVDSTRNSVTEEERLTLSYGQMSAVLVKAIQEQQTIIADQDVKMGQLADQLTNAESTMNLLTEMFTESQQTVAALTARVEALEGTQP